MGCFWIIIGGIAILWASTEPISFLIAVGIFIIYVIVSNVKFNREYRTLMKEKAERERMYPMDINKNNITSSKINTIKEEKTNITCLEELYDWIHGNTQFLVRESDEDYFIIEAPNNTDLKIKINESDNINDNLKRIIKQLEKFDAHTRFISSWNSDISRKYNIFGLPFYAITQHNEMWEQSEYDFHLLADYLKDLLPIENHNENIDDISDYDEDLFDDYYEDDAMYY